MYVPNYIISIHIECRCYSSDNVHKEQGKNIVIFTICLALALTMKNDMYVL